MALQRTGASRFAQNQIQHQRRLAPVAELCVSCRNRAAFTVFQDYAQQPARQQAFMGPIGVKRTLWAGSVRARSQGCARSGRPATFFVAAHAAFPLGWSVGLARVHALVFGIATRLPPQIAPALAEPWGDGCLPDCFERRGRWCRLLCCGGFLSAHLHPRQQYRSVMKPEAATNRGARRVALPGSHTTVHADPRTAGPDSPYG